MKQTFILFFAISAVAILVTSCQPSRVWANNKKNKAHKEYREQETYRRPPPPQPARYYATTALIITPTPGFLMKQHPNGRFYHRTASGYLYWKGYDNRFYIDRSYLAGIRYNQWEYDEWRRYSRQSR